MMMAEEAPALFNNGRKLKRASSRIWTFLSNRRTGDEARTLVSREDARITRMKASNAPVKKIQGGNLSFFISTSVK
jgi:hypothetical protein